MAMEVRTAWLLSMAPAGPEQEADGISFTVRVDGK